MPPWGGRPPLVGPLPRRNEVVRRASCAIHERGCAALCAARAISSPSQSTKWTNLRKKLCQNKGVSSWKKNIKFLKSEISVKNSTGRSKNLDLTSQNATGQAETSTGRVKNSTGQVKTQLDKPKTQQYKKRKSGTSLYIY